MSEHCATLENKMSADSLLGFPNNSGSCASGSFRRTGRASLRLLHAELWDRRHCDGYAA
jgi:hypothetical protein